MRPQTQRVVGWPYGECVRASYATILGVDIERVPRFDPGALGGEDQTVHERQWLASIGFDLIEFSTDPEDELPEEMLDEVHETMPTVQHLMSGISPRGYGHRCVGIGGRVAFDPHPSRAGLVTVYAIGFLVPL